jgi:hypothetical protein
VRRRPSPTIEGGRGGGSRPAVGRGAARRHLGRGRSTGGAGRGGVSEEDKEMTEASWIKKE